MTEETKLTIADIVDGIQRGIIMRACHLLTKEQEKAFEEFNDFFSDWRAKNHVRAYSQEASEDLRNAYAPIKAIVEQYRDKLKELGMTEAPFMEFYKQLRDSRI